MPRRRIESGRLEIKGASARFKQKGTLQAFDRNLAHLSSLRVRATPLPQAKLFLDLEIGEEVFRVWQDATLVNYKEFLEKVEFSGIDNFRALVRHAGRALPPDSRDPATDEFAAGKPPERFANAEELALYDEAVLAGTGLPAATGGGAVPTETEKRARAEAAWTQFAGDIEKAKAERTRSPEASMLGAVLAVMGLVILAFSFRAWALLRDKDESRPRLLPLLALGMLSGMGLVIAGAVFVRRGARPTGPE